MDMSDRWPVLVINLERSDWRMEMMRQQFPLEDFVRIEGVDGRTWESDKLDDIQRPTFTPDGVSYLVDQGILSISSLDRWPLIPCEVGCALGHRKAWEYVVENELEFAIICEDDIVPTPLCGANLQFGVEKLGGMPEDADVLFLTGADTQSYPMRTDENGRLLRGWCNYAYVITKKGAERAIRAQFPMYLPCDIQWWACAFEGYEVNTFVPELEDKGFAYALKEAIVQKSGCGYHTTMTRDGKKPWRAIATRQ